MPSENRTIVERYMDGFNRADHAQILSCLREDVEWIMPGAFHHTGKPAFDREIDNPGFTGTPSITVTTIVEEGDVVVAEGTVRSLRATGAPFQAAFCDVFVMRDGKIARLTSYVLETPAT